MLKAVKIEPSCTAKMAEEIINDYLKQYNTGDTYIRFELLIEGSMNFGSHGNGTTYYTVIIQLYEEDPE